MSTLENQVTYLSRAKHANYAEQCRAARKEYAEILLRRQSPRPDDAERLVEILPLVWPLDNPDYPESYARPEHRPEVRRRWLARDIEALDAIERAQKEINSELVRLEAMQAEKDRQERLFQESLPRVRQLDYLRRDEIFGRHNWQQEQRARDIREAASWVRMMQERIQYRKDQLYRIFQPN